jgi:hypothetical protein
MRVVPTRKRNEINAVPTVPTRSTSLEEREEEHEGQGARSKFAVTLTRLDTDAALHKCTLTATQGEPMMATALKDDPDFAAEEDYTNRVRDEVIATLKRFDGPPWLAGRALAEALGWVMANDPDATTEEELFSLGQIAAIRAIFIRGQIADGASSRQ